MMEVTEFANLLRHDELNVTNEEITFNAMVRWIRYDLEHRKCNTATLLRCVRLGLLNTQVFTEKIQVTLQSLMRI